MKDIILVTGASSDIGIEFIKRQKEGTTILAQYCNSTEIIEKLDAETECKIIPIKADLSEESEIHMVLDKLENELDTPNKIVHFAGPKFHHKHFEDLKWEQFEDEINIEFRSIFFILSRLLPDMAKNQKGKIVLMLSSVTLNIPPKALTHYTAIKYALLGLIKSIASEFGEKNIFINGISPSMVETKFLSNIDTEFVEISAKSHPLKRNATVFDIVPMIEFLLSSNSDYMNGLNIPITGGSQF